MRKNFMLSLAAMASLPMAGLADTTWHVTENPTDSEKGWACEGEASILSTSTPENIYGMGAGVVSYTLTLPKGEYTLERTALSNAKFTVTIGDQNPANVDKKHVIKLDKTTNVVLSLSAIDAKQIFSVTGLKLTLKFNFATDGDEQSAKTVLTNRINTVKSLIAGKAGLPTTDTEIEDLDLTVNYKTLVDSLNKKVAELEKTLTKFKDYATAKESSEAAFELYRDLELYNWAGFKEGTKEGTEDEPVVYSKIERDVLKLQSVPTLYKSIATASTGAFAALKDAYNALISSENDKNGEGTFTQSIYKGIYDEFVADMKAQLRDLEKNYNEDALPSFQDVNKTYDATKGADSKVNNLISSLSTYRAVKVCLDNTEGVYNDQVTALAQEAAKLKHADYYDALIENATACLNKAYQPNKDEVAAFTGITEKDDLIAICKNEYYNDPKKEKSVYAVSISSSEEMRKVVGWYYTGENAYAKQLEDHVGVVAGYVDEIASLEAALEAYKGDNTAVDVEDYEDALGKAQDIVEKIQGNINTTMSGIEHTGDKPLTLDVSYKYKVKVTVDGKEEEKEAGYENLEKFKAGIEEILKDTKTLLNPETGTNYVAFVEAKADLTKRKSDLQAILNETQNILNGLSKTVEGYPAYSAKNIWNKYAFEVKEESAKEKPNTSLQELINKVELESLTVNNYADKQAEYKPTLVEVEKALPIYNDKKELVGPFLDDVKAAYGGYVTITDKLQEWNAAYAEKFAFITNPDVPYEVNDKTNPPTVITYGEELNKLQAAITALETQLTLALSKEGEMTTKAHQKAIAEGVEKTKVTCDILGVKKTDYDAAKAAYELPLAITNANAQLEHVQDIVTSISEALNDAYYKYSEVEAEIDAAKTLYGDAGYAALMGKDTSTDMTNWYGIVNTLTGIKNVKLNGTDYEYECKKLEEDSEKEGYPTLDEVREFLVALDADFVELAKVKVALETLDAKAKTIAEGWTERERLNDYYDAVCNGGDYTYKDAEGKDQVVRVSGFAARAKAIFDTNRDPENAASMKEKYENIKTAAVAFNTNLTTPTSEWYKALNGVDTSIEDAQKLIENSKDGLAYIEGLITSFDNAMKASNENYTYYNKNVALYENSTELFVPVLDEDGDPTVQMQPYATTIAAQIMDGINSSEEPLKADAHGVFETKAKNLAKELSDLAEGDEVVTYSLAWLRTQIESCRKSGSKDYYAKLTATSEDVNVIKQVVKAADQVLADCNANDAAYNKLHAYHTDTNAAEDNFAKKTAQIAKALENAGASAVNEQWNAELTAINKLANEVFIKRNLTKEEEKLFKEGKLPEAQKEYIEKGANYYYTEGILSDPISKFYSQQLTNYFNDLTGVWKRYCNVEDGYYAQVLDNNDKVHAEFLDKYAEVSSYYDSVIASLQNFVTKGFDKDLVQKAIDAIYKADYKMQLEKQKTEEGQKYYELLQYNSDQAFIELVKNGEAQAKSLSTGYKSEVEKIYKGIYGAYHDATDKFNDTSIKNLKTEIGELDGAVKALVQLNEDGEAVKRAEGETGISAFYEEEVITASFKDLTDLLKRATNSYLTDGDLIFNYNGYADELKTAAKDGITAAKEALADNQIAAWQEVWKEENDTVQKYYKLYPTLLDGRHDSEKNYLKDFNVARSKFDQAVAALDEAESKYAGMDKVNEANVHTTYDAIVKFIEKEIPNILKDSDKAFADFNKTNYDNNLAKVNAAISDVNNYFTAGIYVETSALDAVKAQCAEVENLYQSAQDNYRFHLDKDDITSKLDAAVTAAGNLLAGTHQIDRKECEYLSNQVVYLKAYISDANNGVDASKYTEWINAKAVALADYTKTFDDAKNEYKSDAASHAKLIGWQNEIAAKRAEITGFKAEEKKAELLKEIETYSEQYTTASENIGSLFGFQQEYIQSIYGKLTDQSADQTAAVNDAYDNNTLVFNADQLQIAIDLASSKMTHFQNAVNAAQEAKTTHENRCDELIQSLETTGYFGGKLAELQTLISTFDETVQKAFEDVLPNFEANAAKQAYELADLKVNPEDAKALLTASSEMDFDPTLKEFKPEESAASRVATAYSEESKKFKVDLSGATDFYKFFSIVEKQCSKKEADIRAANFETEVLADIAKGIQGLIDNKIIKEGANIINKDELNLNIKAEFAAISTALTDLNKYINAANIGVLEYDIDGNRLENEKHELLPVEERKVDFVADCRQAIFDKIVELSARVEQVIANTDANIYYLGDIDHDKAIDVNDFVTLRLHLLGYAEHQLEGLKLRAADTNNDGQLNIGDLTKLVSMILGENTAAAPARVAKNIVTNDALAVVAEGEGVHQRIGIMLDAQQVYAGCQMDILLPEGVTLISESLGEMADGLSLSSNDLENGNHRVILSSVDGTAMTTGNGAMLWLDVEVGHNYNGEGIELSNILFSNAAGRTFELSVASGETTGLSNVSMTQEVKEKIYNVGGILMDSLKRGVNIIRGNDGSSKKIVK